MEWTARMKMMKQQVENELIVKYSDENAAIRMNQDD